VSDIEPSIFVLMIVGLGLTISMSLAHRKSVREKAVEFEEWNIRWEKSDGPLKYRLGQASNLFVLAFGLILFSMGAALLLERMGLFVMRFFRLRRHCEPPKAARQSRVGRGTLWIATALGTSR